MTGRSVAVLVGCVGLALASAGSGLAQYPATYRSSDAASGIARDWSWYGTNPQIAINRCASAAQIRLDTNGGGRILAITDSSTGVDGGIDVAGLALSNPSRSGLQPPIGLRWRCRADIRGYIVELTIAPAGPGVVPSYAPWQNDHSLFGYRRY